MAVVTGGTRVRGPNMRLKQFTITESNLLVPGVGLFDCLLAKMIIAVRLVAAMEAALVSKERLKMKGSILRNVQKAKMLLHNLKMKPHPYTERMQKKEQW